MESNSQTKCVQTECVTEEAFELIKKHLKTLGPCSKCGNTEKGIAGPFSIPLEQDALLSNVLLGDVWVLPVVAIIC